MSEAEPTSDIAALTVQLLSAYLANNTVPSEDLAGLIRSTREALTQGTDTFGREEMATFTPAVPVRKSLASPDHIISLIDGKPYKTLKRHLMGHGLTPEAYRSRYNLPANYPMVAPVYAEHRRNIAKEAGLETRRSASEKAPAPQAEDPSGASIEGAGTIEPQAAPEGVAETKPSATTKKSKAGGKSRPSATVEATLDQVAPTSNGGQAHAAEQDTSSEAPTQQSSLDDPTPVTHRAKATSSAKKQGTKAMPAKLPKSQPGKSKRDAAIEPAPASQTAPEGSSDAADKQDLQTTVTKPKPRAKLGLFGRGGAGPGELADGSADQSAESSSAPQEPASGEGGGSAKPPAKRKSPKRMARTPKASSDSQGNEASNEDEAAG